MRIVKEQVCWSMNILNKFIKEQNLTEKDIINIYGNNGLYYIFFRKEDEIK